MKSLTYIPALLGVATSTLAAPSRPGPSSFSERSESASDPDCSHFTPAESGNYIVNPDQWGQVSSTTCVQIHPFSGASLSWSAQWSWPNGGTNIKSYPNAELSNWTCMPLGSYRSIQSSWTWDYSPEPVSADVSYDAFISIDSCSASHKAEIMIWLAAYDLSPISDTGATPHTKNAVPGWDLFVGTNAQTNVPCYSFVAQSSPMKAYEGDLLIFFNYLKSANFIDGTEYLQETHAGTEPASGTNVVFTTSAFTLSAN